MTDHAATIQTSVIKPINGSLVGPYLQFTLILCIHHAYYTTHIIQPTNASMPTILISSEKPTATHPCAFPSKWISR